MLELPLVFLGGLLGSSHCVGMCGGFALCIGAHSNGVRSALGRQLTWSFGRIFTYSFAGSVAGFVGSRVSGFESSIVSMQAWLAIVAGLLLLIQGAFTAGILPANRIEKMKGVCLAKSFFAGFPSARSLPNVFLAGVMTGFLPCGLVYAYLALAAASGDMLTGMLVMAVFGLGTLPAMVSTGVGGSVVTANVRARVVRIAAWCVMATGVLTVSRGVMFAAEDTSEGIEQCPMCRESSN